MTGAQHDHGRHTASQQDRSNCWHQHGGPRTPATGRAILASHNRIRFRGTRLPRRHLCGIKLRSIQPRSIWSDTIRLSSIWLHRAELNSIGLGSGRLGSVQLLRSRTQRPDRIERSAARTPAADTAPADHSRHESDQHGTAQAQQGDLTWRPVGTTAGDRGCHRRYLSGKHHRYHCPFSGSVRVPSFNATLSKSRADRRLANPLAAATPERPKKALAPVTTSPRYWPSLGESARRPPTE
jgi:hypothetical protein